MDEIGATQIARAGDDYFPVRIVAVLQEILNLGVMSVVLFAPAGIQYQVAMLHHHMDIESL